MTVWREPQAATSRHARPDVSAAVLGRAAVPPNELTLGDAARILHDAVRDHAYEDTPLGPLVVKFGKWFLGERSGREATWDDYERTLSRMSIMLAHLPVTEDHNEAGRLVGITVDVHTDDLRDVIATYPAKSRGKITAAIKSFWKWLDEEELVDRNPASRLRSPKQARPLTYDVFTQDEQAALITNGPNRDRHHAVYVRDRLCVLLLLRTGLRAGELRNLRVEDVNLTDRVILIRDGKGGKSRVVPYAKVSTGPGLGAALEEFMLTDLPVVRRPPEFGDHLFWGGTPDNLKTPGTDGFSAVRLTHSAQPSNQQDWWKAVVKRAGLGRYRSMHMCRHTVATELVRQDENIVTIGELLGHASPNATMVYLHLQVDDVRAALERLEAVRG